MAVNKEVFCICMESNYVTALLGEKNSQGELFFNKIHSVMYEGYTAGKLIDEQGLISAIQKCIGYFSQFRLPKVCFVGIPSEFVKVQIKEASTQFDRTVTLSYKDVDNIFKINNPFKEDSHFTLIEQSAISYKIDDSKTIVEACGVKARKVTARLSYIAALDVLLKLIKQTTAALGIPNVVFIPTIYSNAMYLFSPEERDHTVLFCNMDYNSTSVSIIRGDGVRFLRCFSIGCDSFISDMLMVKSLSVPVAEALYDKLDLVSLDSNETYVVHHNGQAHIFSLVDINVIVKERIDEIAAYIDLCLSKSNMNIPLDMSLFLTGKGLAEIRGAKECLINALNRNVQVVRYNNLAKTGTSSNSTIFSLLSYACDLAYGKTDLKNKFYII